MSHALRPRVLCVDDEPQVLEAIALHLRRRYEVEIATSGAAALEILAAHPDISVIISDMRMPQMDGARFLAASRAIAGDARRILLTGHSDLPAAIAAINEGQICRFLTKPTATRDLLEAVEFAVAQYDEAAAQRRALEQLGESGGAGTDRSTGMSSREAFLDTVARATAEQQLLGEGAGGVLLADIALPAAFVDEAEPAFLDALLRGVAGRVWPALSRPTCVARWDSQRIAVFYGRRLDEGLLLREARNLVDALIPPFKIGEAEFQVETSVGVVDLSAERVEAKVALRYAELAAREARLAGGNTARVFTPESAARAEHRRELIRALRAAIQHDELSLHYQPIVDVARHRVYGIEALARWTHGALGAISPGTFIPIAEESGLIVPFGEWTLKRACRDCKESLAVHARVSVNVSVAQLLDEGFLNAVFQALEDHKLDPTRLEIEITESLFAQDLTRVRSLLEDLRSMGIRIAVDDFGAGYSSLTYLNRLPVDALKTDGSFMRSFSAGGEAIIAATLQMAEKLGVDVVVEGVETPAMLEQALSVGASFLQGYHFARPMPPSMLARWWADYAAADQAAGVRTVT